MLFLSNSMRDLHEHLTYFSKPEDKSAINKIQLYLNYYLTYFKLANALDENKSDPVFTLKINLKINGVTYTESSEGIIDALAQLADADGFDLDVRYSGKKGDISKEMGECSLLYLDVVDNYYGMSEYLKNSSDRNLEYKMMAYYGDSDTFASRYINADGYIDNYLEECGTVTESGNGYYLCPTNNLSILANFDFDKYSVESENMKKVISDYVTDEQDSDLLKELWDEGEYIGITDLSDSMLNLNDFIEFTDTLNEVLSGIDDETLNIRTDGVLYDLEKFVAVMPFYNAEENKIKFWISEFVC